MASLTRLAVFASPSQQSSAAWAPDGLRVLVSWRQDAWFWDFSRPEAAPSAVSLYIATGSVFHSWSPGGASYFLIRKAIRRPDVDGQSVFDVTVEELTVSGSLVRAVTIQSTIGLYKDNPVVFLSPDAHALLVTSPFHIPSSVVVFD